MIYEFISVILYTRIIFNKIDICRILYLYLTRLSMSKRPEKRTT